ncbi:RBBP9/YdeN family alpha/beta hydrolase [Methylocystis parvus]|uniref:Alpha/beta hydrolase n=1 Tax=Methylocystis parvus TaxID=134 RepID=A0A6B8M5H9_9HYPH|nr:alpha/beta hydrolase [Methylocystis parvus]QGM97029.1 alpha/beta hydrolase [Methylocystis parvus]WBJ99076.1 alpha/beta hydrolase [Methylocystis parvus OBBP]
MRAAEADILVIPGYLDSGPDHWQSRWEKKLSTARRVQQRDWANPKRDEWVGTIAREIRAAPRPAILVAHSLGVVAALHAAQQSPEKIAGAFLVAPPSEQVIRELPTVDSAFLPVPRARLPFPAILVGGDNDPYADLLFPRRLAEDIGARFIDAGAAGHINVESGHGPWPEGLLAFAHFVAKL